MSLSAEAFALVMANKQTGNTAFSEGQIEEALKYYQMALGHFKGVSANTVQEAEHVKILSNSAECFLQLNDAFQAEKAAAAALEIDASHLKSRYRRSKARLAQASDLREGKEQLLEAALQDIQFVLNDQTTFPARKHKKLIESQLRAIRNRVSPPVESAAWPTEIICGKQVNLLEHIDSPCFGGKNSLWTLCDQVFFKAVVGDTSAQSQLQELADGSDAPSAAHAQYLWGKFLLPDPSPKSRRRQRIVPESESEAKRYWLKAASHKHAFATDGLGYIAQRNAMWEDAISAWEQTLELCFLPSTAYCLGVVHDPLQKAAGPHAAFYNFDESLKHYKAAKDAVLQEPRGTFASIKWHAIMSLAADNQPQTETTPLARHNYHGLLRHRRRSEFDALQSEGAREVGAQVVARLPLLYPGDCDLDWNDGPAMSETLAAPPDLRQMFQMVSVMGAGRQDDLDQRWAHMQYLYKQKGSGERTVAEHVAIFAEAGIQLEVVDGKVAVRHTQADGTRSSVRLLPLSQLAPFSELIPVSWTRRSDYTRPDFPIPRCCDHCNTETVRRCRCGEAFCSHSCLLQGWPAHKAICRQVYDNSQLACTVKQIYWTQTNNGARDELLDSDAGVGEGSGGSGKGKNKSKTRRGGRKNKNKNKAR